MSGRCRSKIRFASAAVCALIALLMTMTLPRMMLRGQSEPEQSLAADVITVSADYAQEWSDTESTVTVLRGRCRITQGETTLTANRCVIRRPVEHSDGDRPATVSIYLEDAARLDQPGQSRTDSSMTVQLITQAGVRTDFRYQLDDRPGSGDALVARAEARFRETTRSPNLEPTQLVVEEDHSLEPGVPTVQFQQPATPLRRVRVFPRSAVSPNIVSFQSTDTVPPEQVWVITGGVNLLVDGLTDTSGVPLGTVDLAADRMVIWTQADGGELPGETIQTQDTPFQVYLEGNIVVRQGPHVVRATRAVYDAREDRGLLLDAELRSFLPELGSELRVRGQRIRQLARDHFHAQNAWTTTSRFGRPSYRLQATDIYLEPRYPNPWIGAQDVRPVSGAATPEPVLWARSFNNTFLIGEVPVFYTPYLSFPAEDPNIPIRRASVRNDSIFGVQLRTTWDLYKLLGIEQPRGMQWDLHADYMSDRGPAIGTGGNYVGTGLFGLPGPYRGEGLGYYIYDDGRDNLGRDRKFLEPPDRNRGRATLRHRQDMPNGVSLIGELGLISDRNFLEQYYENEFDEGKDVETLIYGVQHYDNWAWSALGRVQLNDFENTTEWLPRGDLYVLSEPLLNGMLTWSSHTYGGYGKLNGADKPTDPNDIFTPLPFVADVDGAVFMTRHELDAPFDLGPVHIVPYAMGEAAFWDEDLQGQEMTRLMSSTGVRSSVLFWRTFPYVQSRVLNLNGLAHKIRLEGDYGYTTVDEPLGRVAQYNEFDDNSQERYRQRFVDTLYFGSLPPQYEPRFYAVRNGVGLPVTAPWHELVDDQQVLRLAVRQRLQTKTGPPERLRIRDWMLFDLEASYFPEADRDNFGEEFGLLSARFQWNVGERTSLLANTQFDLFDDAQQLWDLGVLTQRSARGSFYMGVRQVSALGFTSQILTASYSYQMSPKWISTASTAYDIGESRNIGQSVLLTRVGPDLLWHVGLNWDESKQNAGVAFAIEPRFGPFAGSGRSTHLSSLLGQNNDPYNP